MGGDAVGDGVETGAVCPDLYAHMRYRVRWDGRYVAGVNHVSGLLRGLPGGRRADGQPALPPSVAPTPTHWLPVVLERGLTRDAEFVAWAARQAASPRAQASIQASGQAAALVSGRRTALSVSATTCRRKSVSGATAALWRAASAGSTLLPSASP